MTRSRIRRRCCPALHRLLRCLLGEPVRIDWIVSTPQPKEKPVLTIEITNEQKIVVTLTPKTLAGNAAQVDDVPIWERLSGTATVDPSADGLSATLTSSDTPGESRFRVVADADLGDGVETIEDVVVLNVASAKAQNLGLVAAEPVLK